MVRLRRARCGDLAASRTWEQRCSIDQTPPVQGLRNRPPAMHPDRWARPTFHVAARGDVHLEARKQDAGKRRRTARFEHHAAERTAPLLIRPSCWPYDVRPRRWITVGGMAKRTVPGGVRSSVAALAHDAIGSRTRGGRRKRRCKPRQPRKQGRASFESQPSTSYQYS